MQSAAAQLTLAHTPSTQDPMQPFKKASPPARSASKPAGQAKTPVHGHKPPGEIRIIGGLYKRSKLAVPNIPGLRPTPDRVRETLFNWLGQDLNGWRCLDAYAGTGALGFEAASRGAAQVLMVENNAALVAALTATKTKLGAAHVQIQRGDALAALRAQSAGSMDLIFIDPPFDSSDFSKIIEANVSVISSSGAIYLEAPRTWTDAELEPMGLRVAKSGKAGAVHYHLLVKA
jgi:16S rRNA (guanine966-N2)-methyltransferase